MSLQRYKTSFEDQKLDALIAKMSNKHSIDRNKIHTLVDEFFKFVKKQMTADDAPDITIPHLGSFQIDLKRCKKQLASINAQVYQLLAMEEEDGEMLLRDKKRLWKLNVRRDRICQLQERKMLQKETGMRLDTRAKHLKLKKKNLKELKNKVNDK